MAGGEQINNGSKIDSRLDNVTSRFVLFSILIKFIFAKFYSLIIFTKENWFLPIVQDAIKQWQIQFIDLRVLNR